MVVEKGKNFAAIENWGKSDTELILSINDSISVTLDPDHLWTAASVAVSSAFTHDCIGLTARRYLFPEADTRIVSENFDHAVMLRMSRRASRSKKKDWEKLHFHIVSHSNFPIAAGLASSAAGLACLAFSLGKLMNVKDDHSRVSAIASGMISIECFDSSKAAQTYQEGKGQEMPVAAYMVDLSSGSRGMHV